MRVSRRTLKSRLSCERGGVLPWFAIFLPVLMIFMAFVIDFGNWFEHRRHLQTQADAAALAGGTRWGFPCVSATEANMEGTARDYGGPHTTDPTAPYNAQVGGTPADRMYLLVNSANYWNEGGIDYDDGRPCATGFLDVKMTETNLPFFFPFAGSLVPAINARARVAILEAAAVGGPQLLPVFVRDVNPGAVAALFVRENADGTKTLLDAKYMTRAGSCSSGFACWSNAPSPADVTIAERISVVVAISNFPPCTGGPGNCLSLSGTPDTICSQFAAECYWADSATGAVQAGIVFIRGYEPGGGGGPPNPPVLRNVELLGTGLIGGATCSDGYFAYANADCSVGIRAEVDLGGHPPADAQMAAFGGNCPNNNGCPLSYVGGFWEGTIPIDAAADPPTVPFRIRWTLRNTTLNAPYGDCGDNLNNTPCEALFENGAFVHRTFSASDQFSGPVRGARVFDVANPSGVANSFPLGAAKQLYLAVQLAGAVATDVNDPPIQLRAVDTSQSAIDCTRNNNYREEITLGCPDLYKQNARLTAPDPCDPPYGTTQVDLFNGPQPFDCVAVGPGASVGQFSDGIQGRVLNNQVVCTACPSACPTDTGSFTRGRNYWTSMFGLWDDGDPRIIVVFMVPFGAFRQQGRALYPITNFGAFYITGWGGNGGGNDDPCPGADSNVPTGWLSGHFIKYKLPSNSGGGLGPCTISTTTPCVVVLTD